MEENQWADQIEELKGQRIMEHLKRRKLLINQNLSSKRQCPTFKKQEKLDKFLVSEDPEYFQMVQQPEEIIQEEVKVEEVIKEKVGLDLNQHYKKKNHKDKKKCWNCFSRNHLKKSCPLIRCYFCKKKGHLKANCIERKINFVFNRLKERFQEKTMKKKEKEENEKLKKEQKILEKKIAELRSSYMTFFLDKTQKGEVFKAKWKDLVIGDYIGPGLPTTAIENIQKHRYKFEYLNVLLEKDIPIKRLTLYDSLSNWCGCGEIDAEKNVFLWHVRRHHKGMIPKKSQINRYPWLDWIKFKNDDLEEEFCHSLSNLNNYN